VGTHTNKEATDTLLKKQVQIDCVIFMSKVDLGLFTTVWKKREVASQTDLVYGKA
jgi:hypothetical protein